MNCFIGDFITEFSSTLGKKVNFKDTKDVKDFILNKLKKNQNSKFQSDLIYENKLQIISNILFENNFENVELQKIKQHIIIDLLLGKKIDIDQEEKKIISTIDKNILIIRGQIVQIIKEGINDSTIKEDPLNEVIVKHKIKPPFE